MGAENLWEGDLPTPGVMKTSRPVPEPRPEMLRNPDAYDVNPFVVDLLLHPLYDQYWKERTVDYAKINIPAYIGADWGCYGIHLPAAFRSWEKLEGTEKR